MNRLNKTDDVRIDAVTELLPPIAHLYELPISDEAEKLVVQTRQEIADLVHGKDNRLLVIVGPCSIHDPAAAVEYAQRLLPLRRQYEKELLIVMRVYFEKPRTTVGWKGLINDPHLDGSFDINFGLRQARQLLLQLNNMGMPASTEFLDMITPQYYADLISWGAIGARTTESQVHRELSSGLSCPVGFKNGTDGNLKIAIDAIGAASHPHHFLSVTKAGHSAIVHTRGNPDCHVILRGGKEPNYSAEHVQAASEQLAKAGVTPKLMVDCSHANSRKDFRRQMEVAQDVAAQIRAGEQNIMGVMVESHLVEGRQDKPEVYGQSITDACIGWDETEAMLALLAQAQRESGRIYWQSSLHGWRVPFRKGNAPCCVRCSQMRWIIRRCGLCVANSCRFSCAMSPCRPTVRFICRPICITTIFQSSLHIGRVCGCTNARTFGSTAWAIPCCVAASASHCRAVTSNARPTATDICCRTAATCRSSIWSSRRALWRIISSDCGTRGRKIPRWPPCCSGFCSSRIMRICCRRACGLDEKAACTWFSECRLLFGCTAAVFQWYSELKSQ